MNLNHELLLDLAAEIGRCCAIIPPDFASKMARRLQRKFKVKLSPDIITELSANYVSIYRFAAVALKECLVPNNDEFASLSHIDAPKFMSKLTTQFPNENNAVLNEIAHWVIQYEYLR
jgi:hypothetical protein